MSIYRVRLLYVPFSYVLNVISHFKNVNWKEHLFQSLSAPEITALLKNQAALQLAADYGMPAIAVPQPHVIPQQFTIQVSIFFKKILILFYLRNN